MTNSADPEKKTDMDLHCLQRQGVSGSSRTIVKQATNNFERPVCDISLVRSYNTAIETLASSKRSSKAVVCSEEST